MPYGMHDGGWGVWWMVVSWVIVVAVVALVIRALMPTGGGGEHIPDPGRILEERFARGEITEEEYRERQRVIAESRH